MSKQWKVRPDIVSYALGIPEFNFRCWRITPDVREYAVLGLDNRLLKGHFEYGDLYVSTMFNEDVFISQQPSNVQFDMNVTTSYTSDVFV